MKKRVGGGGVFHLLRALSVYSICLLQFPYSIKSVDSHCSTFSNLIGGVLLFMCLFNQTLKLNMMNGWINYLVSNPSYKSNPQFIFKQEFLKCNISPDEEVLRELTPEDNQSWNCPEFLSKVWEEILSADKTSFVQTPDFTFEKICEMEFHHLAPNCIDKLYVKMLHEEAVEYGRTQLKILEHWLQVEGITRYLKKHGKILQFCSTFHMHKSASIYKIRSLVNHWRHCFRQTKIPYQIWFEIAGEYFLEDVSIAEPSCAPAFFC